MSLTHQLYLQKLREIDSYSPSRFDAYRGPLLATLIDHAWREVPAYRDRVSRFVEGDRFDLTNWTKIPILSGTELERSGSAFQGRTLRPPAEEVEEIAPSAAMPIRRRSVLSRIAAECERELVYEMWGLNLFGPLAILHPDQPAMMHGRAWSITFTRNHWFAGPSEAPPAEQLKWLASTKARVLRTTGAIAGRLADASSVAAEVPQLDTVVISDVVATPDLAAKTAAAFGGKLHHLLEWPTLGILAAARNDGSYTAPAASNVLEIVDKAGLPVANGQTGELVITPLYEFATPLLRFSTGVAAVMPDQPRTLLGVRDLAGLRGRVGR